MVRAVRLDTGPTAAEREQLTFSAGVCLNELVAGAGLVKLGGQPRQLWKNLVDDTDLGS